jgi:hypothetical protein
MSARNRLRLRSKFLGHVATITFPDTPRKVENASADGSAMRMRSVQLRESVDVRTRHNACPSCGDMGDKAGLGDGRLYCRRCRRKFTPQASAWDSIRLSEEVKRNVVRRFVEDVGGYRMNRVNRPSPNTRDRIRQLCRAACAKDVGISTPWEAVAFNLLDANGRGVELVGLKFTRIEGLNQIAPYSRAVAVDREQTGKLVTAHIGALQPWGKHRDRFDLWLRQKQRRVITSDVQEESDEVQFVRRKGSPDPEPELLKFAQGVSKLLRLMRSVDSRYLHLHVGEAWVRYEQSFRAEGFGYATVRGLLTHHLNRDLGRVIRGQ